MGPGRKDIPVERVIDEYLNGGSLREIGRRYGVSYEWIRKLLMRHNVERRNADYARNRLKEKAELVNKIFESNEPVTVDELLEMVGMSLWEYKRASKHGYIDFSKSSLINPKTKRAIKRYRDIVSYIESNGGPYWKVAEKFGVSIHTVNRAVRYARR